MSKFVVYKAKDGWRWRLQSVNGKVIAESGEAYKKRPNSKLATRVYRDLGRSVFEIRTS